MYVHVYIFIHTYTQNSLFFVFLFSVVYSQTHTRNSLFFVLLVSVAGPTFIAVKERLSLLQLPGECDGHVDEEEQVDHHKNQDDA